MTKDESIQLVSYNKHEKAYIFNKKALKRIIEENDVQDLPVTIISVAGLFRKGKSFLLNFFLRYLYAEEREKWLSDSSDSVKGFEWRGGRKRNTEGIHIWSKIFKLPTTDGSQVAVILMDTQGTFDGKSSNKTGAVIFALSALVSSVQVYNLSQQINENDLENLLWFTEYASFVQKETDQKPFQSLLFLVRDWHHFMSYPYGEEGGKQLLNEKLQITPDQEPSLTKVRNDIRSTFEKLSCFLLPYPGKIVATDMNFNGSVKDIDEEFITNIRAFIPSVLSPNNLVVKNINGLELTSSEFVELFATYLKHYNNDELPDEMSKAEAAAEAYYAPLLERCVNIYKTGMMKMLDEHHDRIEDCTLDVFRDAHEHMQTKANSMFSKAKWFKKDLASIKSEILTARIQEQFQLFQGKRNRMYKTHAAKHYNALASGVVKEYNNKMIAILDKSEEDIEHYTLTAFANTHEKNKKMAIEKFLDENRFGEYDATECLEKMKQDIDDSFGINESRRKSKFQSAVISYYSRLCESCLYEYNNKMRKLMDKTDMVMNSFIRLHESYKAVAMNQFTETRSYSENIQSKYSKNLQARIEASFVLYQEDRISIIKHEEERVKSDKELKLSAQEHKQKLEERKMKYNADVLTCKEKLKAEVDVRKLEFEAKKLEFEATEKRLVIENEINQTRHEYEIKKEDSMMSFKKDEMKLQAQESIRQANLELEKLKLEGKIEMERLENDIKALTRKHDLEQDKTNKQFKLHMEEINRRFDNTVPERRPWYKRLFGFE